MRTRALEEASGQTIDYYVATEAAPAARCGGKFWQTLPQTGPDHRYARSPALGAA